MKQLNASVEKVKDILQNLNESEYLMASSQFDIPYKEYSTNDLSEFDLN